MIMTQAETAAYSEGFKHGYDGYQHRNLFKDKTLRSAYDSGYTEGRLQKDMERLKRS